MPRPAKLRRAVTLAALVLLGAVAACASFSSSDEGGTETTGDGGAADGAALDGAAVPPDAAVVVPDDGAVRVIVRDFDEGGTPGSAAVSFTSTDGEGTTYLRVGFEGSAKNPTVTQETVLVDGPQSRLVVSVDARGFTVPSVGDAGTLATTNLLVVSDAVTPTSFLAFVQVVRERTANGESPPFLRFVVRGTLPDGTGATCLTDARDSAGWLTGRAAVTWTDGGAGQELRLGPSANACAYVFPRPQQLRVRYGMVDTQNGVPTPWAVGLDNIRLELE